MATLKQFILKKRPQVVVVAAECREALSDGEVARIFTSSPRSEVSYMG